MEAKRMKSTKKKNVKVGNKIYAQGRLWNKEAYAKYRQYQAEFMRNTYLQFTMRINKGKEADIAAKLKEQGNASEYIKMLIRADIANGQD
jgi:hypothetical protein